MNEAVPSRGRCAGAPGAPVVRPAKAPGRAAWRVGWPVARARYIKVSI